MIGITWHTCAIIQGFGKNLTESRQGKLYEVAFNFYKFSINFTFNWWSVPK